MELTLIVERIAEGLPIVDARTKVQRHNQRTKQPYLQGVKTLLEWQFVDALMDWWFSTYPSDFNTSEPQPWAVQRLYSSAKTARGKLISKDACDLVLATGTSTLKSPEWALEIKHIALVGDNGKTNDYPIPKLLSPYLKDRSLMHDIDKLMNSALADKKAVIGYCFNYDATTIAQAAALFPAENTKNGRVYNLLRTCKSVDPLGMKYSSSIVVEFTDRIFQVEKLVTPVISRSFNGAWRHPMGGEGDVFAWQILDRPKQ